MIKRESITFEEYSDFCTSVGWPLPNKSRFEKSLQKSIFIKYILNDKTIGIGRLIKEYKGLYRIADLIIQKESQQKGIGKKILQQLIEIAKEESETEKTLIYLLTDIKNIPFYQKFNFHIGKENKDTGMKTMFLWLEKNK